MADKNQPGLSQKIKMLSNKFTSSTIILSDSNTKTFVSYVSQNMSKASIDHQLLLLNTNRKLCVYTLFKTDTTKTDSLDAIKNPLDRTAINKFRLGNHQLLIETGRQTVPKTPEKLRICTSCQSNDVENESHVLFSCALYNNFRSKFFDEITGKYKFFKDLSINSKILFLFNSIDPFICRSVAAFLFVVMNYRYQTFHK